MMKVPFVDLKVQYSHIKIEIDQAIESVIADTAFIRGKYVNEFENLFAEKNETKHCMGVANGTDAIFIALKSLGIGIGDEVLTVANSWISTSETISLTGAKPVFIDIDPRYYTIDVNLIEQKINEKTKAIIPVHLYGQPADMTKIMGIAKKNNLFVIEDCAQAHFAKHDGKIVGTFGDAATFSFYPGKNLGAYGDAGAIITNNDQLAEKMRMYANHGALIKHHHKIEGINSRLDGLQAAILTVKLRYIDEWNQKRRNNAMRYNSLLSEIEGIITPEIHPTNEHIFHVYCIRISKRDELKDHLQKNGIGTAIHYPTALPNMEAYKYLGHLKEDFPIASKYQDEILSLPMYPELRSNQIEYITNLAIKFSRKI